MQERGDVMKTLQRRNILSIAGKIMLAFGLSVMIGSVSVVPAFGDDQHRDMREHDNGRYEHRNAEHDRYEHRNAGYDRDAHGRPVYRPYGYAPPPVIYTPTPPAGISIFFPPIVIPIPRP